MTEPHWLQQQDGLLLLSALLLCVLLLLVRRREEAARQRRARPAPMSPTELGRTLFVAARSGDLDVYRELFINGVEADTLLGEHAASYLDQRSYAMLQERMEDIQAQIPRGAIFAGVDTYGHGLLSARLRLLSGRTLHVRLGQAVQLGPLWRMLSPQPRLEEISPEAIEPVAVPG